MIRLPFAAFFAINAVVAPITGSLAALSSQESGSGSSSIPQNLTVIGDYFYFSADDGLHGRQLWGCDAKNALNLHLLADIEPGPAPSNPQHFRDFGGQVLFDATTHASGGEPWIYNPSLGTAKLLKDFMPGPASSMTVLAGMGKGLFYLLVRTAEIEKWDLFTVKPDSLELSYVARVGQMLEFSGTLLNDGRLIFSTVRSLWVTDGTKEGTQKIFDSERPGAMGWITSLGQHAVFSAVAPDSGIELFASDGTRDGTGPIRDIHPGPMRSGIGQVCAWGTKAVFQADDGECGPELWITDGTADGTVMVKDIAPGKPGSDPHYLLNAGDSVYFVATDGTSGIELWRTDGTETGTRRITDLAPGPQTGAIWSPAEFNNRVYFCANSREYGEEIFSAGAKPGV